MAEEKRSGRDILDGCLWTMFFHRDFGRPAPGCMAIVLIVAIGGAVALPQLARWWTAQGAQKAAVSLLRDIARAQAARREAAENPEGRGTSSFRDLQPHFVNPAHEALPSLLIHAPWNHFLFRLVPSGPPGRFRAAAVPVTDDGGDRVFLVGDDGEIYERRQEGWFVPESGPVPDPAKDPSWERVERER